MLRAHAGLVTAMVAKDEVVRTAQLKSIIQEHAERAAGDPVAFTGRMAKQIEAGVLITHMVLTSLAKRLDMTDAEAQEVIAQAISQVDDGAFPE